MSQTRDSALQRIKIGVTGLVIVLLFVSLANLVNQRVIENESDDVPVIAQPGPDENLPDEPLAELGLAPVDSAEDKAKAKVKAKAAVAKDAAEAPNLKIQPEQLGQ